MTNRSENLARSLARRGALLAALGAVFYAPDATACGGLFCSQASPVNQAAERIVFAAEGGTVTAIIEILYQGPSESFSWVLPVPGTPEVGVSSTLALTRLQSLTNPQYTMQTVFVGDCSFGSTGSGVGGTSAVGSTGTGGAGGTGPVTVLEGGTVGPFDYEIIAVDDSLPSPATAAVDWLGTNGYDVSALGEERLGPYLADGLNLLAFRLTKDADAGSIRPVMLTYDSDLPMIPIRPTAVAATENMGVMVWVLGEARAVPLNYRSLVLNETLINWFNPNQNYNDVVIAAADEASGHGFVTEYADFVDLSESIATAFELTQLSGLTAELSLQQLLQSSLVYATWDGYRDVLAANVPLREDTDVALFTACISCYFQGLPPEGTEEDDPIFGTDPELFLSELERLVVGPMRATRALFANHDAVTRLYTTLSPDEMTEDPVFDFNPDLPAVSNRHIATRRVHCSNLQGPWEATLPDGMVVAGTGSVWPITTANGAPATQRIETQGLRGQGDLVLDNSSVIADIVNANNATIDTTSLSVGGSSSGGEAGSSFAPSGHQNGCACRAAGSSGSLLGMFGLGALGALLLARRRRDG